MKRNRKPELPEWDDGRTIANMNAEGMPWYQPNQKPSIPSDAVNPSGDAASERHRAASQGLTREEAHAYTMGAVRAALLVAIVLCGGIVLFVLFCQFVWFR